MENKVELDMTKLAVLAVVKSIARLAFERQREGVYYHLDVSPMLREAVEKYLEVK